MKWILDRKERLINLDFYKSIRKCQSKNGSFEIRVMNDEEDLVIFSSLDMEFRDQEFIILAESINEIK